MIKAFTVCVCVCVCVRLLCVYVGEPLAEEEKFEDGKVRTKSTQQSGGEQRCLWLSSATASPAVQSHKTVEKNSKRKTTTWQNAPQQFVKACLCFDKYMTFICTFHCKQNLVSGRHFQGSWTSLRSVYWVSCNARCLPAVSIGVHKLTGASWFLSQLQSLILQRVADGSHNRLIYLDFIIPRWMCKNQGTTRSRHTFLCFPSKLSLNFQTPVLFLYVSCLMKATTV